MNVKNVNYGINYGHIGDQLNIHQYIQIVQDKFLEPGGTNNPKIKSGYKNILMLELLKLHLHSLEEEFEKYEYAMKNNRYPLKIRVTPLVDDCAQGVYYNGGNVQNDVWEIVDSIFTLVCSRKYGVGFYANRVYVGNHIYYELYPAKK